MWVRYLISVSGSLHETLVLQDFSTKIIKNPTTHLGIFLWDGLMWREQKGNCDRTFVPCLSLVISSFQVLPSTTRTYCYNRMISKFMLYHTSLKNHWSQNFSFRHVQTHQCQVKIYEIQYLRCSCEYFFLFFSIPTFDIDNLLMVNPSWNLNIPSCSQYCNYFCQWIEKWDWFPLSPSIYYSGFDHLIQQYARDWVLVFKTWKIKNLRCAKQHGCTLGFTSACPYC